MEHIYNDTFFDYIDQESCVSSEIVLSKGLAWLKPNSVLDVGCGRGAWLRHWVSEGIADVAGVDGDFIDKSQLHFPSENFYAHDLSNPFDLSRKFDLVQSLEVAEHLPPASAEGFVSSLCAHGNHILFSAAVPGQGGEHHVNERPQSYWRDLFLAQGYRGFDCVRRHVLTEQDVRPWYRFNTLLFVHTNDVDTLPTEVRGTEISSVGPVAFPAPISWRLRLLLVGLLPRSAVTALAKLNARLKVSTKANHPSA